MNEIEEYLEKFIDKVIPKPLWPAYDAMVKAIKAGFYEGIKFERERHKNQTKNP